MKRALIVGATGQDGTLLAELLSHKSVPFLGLNRTGVIEATSTAIKSLDIQDARAVEKLVQHYQPSHIFYLAAHHHSSEDKLNKGETELWRKSMEVQVLGLVHFLEALRLHVPGSKFFYASSSHIFGSKADFPQTEDTPMAPENIYAVTKVAGHHACRYYREQYGQFISIGILYNHESIYRQDRFLSQRIIRGAHAIQTGQKHTLTLGDLCAVVDWGYAPDYVEAMVRILELPHADNFIIATNQLHTVRDFAQIAFDELGLDYTKHVTEDSTLIRPHKAKLSGDYSHLKRQTDWEPTLSFEAMVRKITRQFAQSQSDNARQFPPA